MQRPCCFTVTVLAFLSELNLSLADLHFSDDVRFTYYWAMMGPSLDRVAVTTPFLSTVTSVHSILEGRNISDHNPLNCAFSLDLSSTTVSCLI